VCACLWHSLLSDSSVRLGDPAHFPNSLCEPAGLGMDRHHELLLDIRYGCNLLANDDFIEGGSYAT
jgi:hypothetical protein